MPVQPGNRAFRKGMGLEHTSVYVEQRCAYIPLTPAPAQRSSWLRGELRRRGKPRTQPDMLIAGTAQVQMQFPEVA